jgi:hypothetical protein
MPLISSIVVLLMRMNNLAPKIFDINPHSLEYGGNMNRQDANMAILPTGKKSDIMFTSHSELLSYFQIICEQLLTCRSHLARETLARLFTS